MEGKRKEGTEAGAGTFSRRPFVRTEIKARLQQIEAIGSTAGKYFCHVMS